MSDPKLWTGLVELKPLNRKEYGAAGAFTNVVTWACDSEGFRRKAETIAAELQMYVVGVEEDGPLSTSPEDWSDEIDDMVRRAESNPTAIVYGTFHRYPHDEG